LVRRTWAPRGRTPTWARRPGGGPRQKVSVASALWRSPHRDRLGLFSRTLVNDYFDNGTSAAFLETLLKQLTGRVVVWDGGSMPKGDPITQLQALLKGRLSVERFRRTRRS
jgi:hypothetical protein